MIEINKSYQRSSSVVGRKVGNDLVLVPIRQNIANMDFIYTLNDVAGRVWELLDAPTTFEAIVSTILQEYSVEREQAEADVTELLTKMKEIEAIEEL